MSSPAESLRFRGWGSVEVQLRSGAQALLEARPSLVAGALLGARLRLGVAAALLLASCAGSASGPSAPEQHGLHPAAAGPVADASPGARSASPEHSSTGAGSGGEASRENGAQHAPGAAKEGEVGEKGAEGEVGEKGAEGEAGREPAAAACPEGMVHVQKAHCPDLERRCVKSEYDKSNRITICHQFDDAPSKCRGPRSELSFCIDRFEFPNQEGGHPPVMVDWHEATAECQVLGKRLCFEREWVAACEGPEDKPFPYGYERSSKQCNIDNRWINPNLGRVYARRAEIQEKELERLDQSVPSGSMPGCVSDYGVYDLTGNFDEWANADKPRPNKRAGPAALKGGAWGHVRNACRPVTTSHDPEFKYYFISFRCCKDARGSSAR